MGRSCGPRLRWQGNYDEIALARQSWLNNHPEAWCACTAALFAGIPPATDWKGHWSQLGGTKSCTLIWASIKKEARTEHHLPSPRPIHLPTRAQFLMRML